MQSEQSQDLDREVIQEFRIERGAQVLGTDGPLGSVELIVVDQTSGALQGLVVRGEAGTEMELPAEYLESATGDRVYLSIGKADLAARPDLALPYRPELYQPVDEGVTVPPSQVLDRNADGPVLTEMEADAVEIASFGDKEAQMDDLGTNTAPLDVADEPTVVLEPGAAAPRGDGRPASQPDEARVASSEPESALPDEAAQVEAARTEAVPLEATPTAAPPAQTLPPETAPAATSAAETGPLSSPAAESLFPGTAPLTPADQAVADEARAAAQSLQPPQPLSAPPADVAPPAPSAAATVGPFETPIPAAEGTGADATPSPEPRSVPVLRPDRAGAIPEAMRGAESRTPVQQAPSTVQPNTGSAFEYQPSASGTVLRRMLAAGILAGTGAAAGAYLIWRGQQARRKPGALARARMRMQDARSAGDKLATSMREAAAIGLPRDLPARLPDVGKRLPAASAVAATRIEPLRRGLPWSLPGNVPVSVPGLRPGPQAAARTGAALRDALPDVGASLPAIAHRGQDVARALGLVKNLSGAWTTASDWLANLGSRASGRASNTTRGDVAGRARDGATQLMRLARSTGERLSGSAGGVRGKLTGQAARLTARAAIGPKPRRALRRAGRRARWFRRGLMAGLAWGILYAPEAGNDARSRLLDSWQHMQNSAGLAPSEQPTQRGGESRAASAAGSGTGPRPRNPAEDQVALHGAETSTPLLQPRSEEPLLPPPLPESASDEVPGSPSQI